MDVMKRILSILFCFSGIILCGQNGVNYSLVDSVTIFTKVDSLKKDKHTEFAFSKFTIVFETQEELDIILKKLGGKILPEENLIYWISRTYYPETEYINNDDFKIYGDTYIYVDKTFFETNVYVLRPSGRMKR